MLFQWPLMVNVISYPWRGILEKVSIYSRGMTLTFSGWFCSWTHWRLSLTAFLIYYSHSRGWHMVFISFLIFNWFVFCCWSSVVEPMVATKTGEVIEELYLLRDSDMKSADKADAKRGVNTLNNDSDRCNNSVTDILDKRILGDRRITADAGVWSHTLISSQDIGDADMAESKDTSLMLTQSASIHVFVETFEKARILIGVNPGNTVFELRKKIYDILGIALNHWRLGSCGGKLLWDSRTLSE